MRWHRRWGRGTFSTVGPAEVLNGERALAWATAADGTVVAGTRDALHLVLTSGGPVRLGWEQVHSATWEQESERLKVSEVGEFGHPRREWHLEFGADLSPDPSATKRLLGLIRERINASMVLQRHASVTGRRGLRVVARRAPHGPGELVWLVEFDQGIDPDDPAVAAIAEQALAAARDEVGDA